MKRWIGPLALVLCVMTQSVLWFGRGGVVAVMHRERHIHALSRANAALLKTDERLTAVVRSLRRGRGAIEAQARSGLGMIKKGETFYEIVPGSPPSTQTARVFRNQQLAARG
ncbi:septum formation initiator family protein [Acidiferrobacter sp.]|uniref:FtsB family cell division protein n=1 Tax=Acidiferrobacter sp. TaxID=1872107 RepID=UPI00261E5F56|nr:septum formation initiator family protein [Acidiferrobacter sp.]